jgi:hypothetical protein
MCIKYFDKAGTGPEIKIEKMWKLYAANPNKKKRIQRNPLHTVF